MIATIRCKCSYRAVGMLNGIFVRKALKTSNYDQAQKIIRGMEATGAPEQRREAVKIDDAVASFMRDIAARNWQESTQRKFRTLLVDRLQFYASSKGYRFLNQMNPRRGNGVPRDLERCASNGAKEHRAIAHVLSVRFGSRMDRK